LALSGRRCQLCGIAAFELNVADCFCGGCVMLNDPAQAGPSTPAQTDKPPQSPRPRRAGRYILAVVVGLFALIVVAVGAFVALPQPALLTPIIIKTMAAQTGRELKVGAASYSFRPDFVLHFDNVALSNPSGMAGPDLLKAAALDARIDLIGLVKGTVTVSELTITQPVLTLHKDAAGNANWALPPPNPHVRLAQFSLQAGTISYQDEQAGQALQVTNVTASLAQKAATLEAKISGATVWRAEPINLDIDVGDVQALAGGAATSITGGVTSKHINANVTGTVTSANKGRLQGTFNASTPSPLDLSRWLGASPPAGVRLSAVSLAGQIDASPTLVALQKTQLTLAGANSVWDVQVDLTAKPKLTATIEAPLLDLTVLSGTSSPARLSVEAVTPGPPPITVVPAYDSLSADLDKLDQQLGSAPPSLAPQVEAVAPSSLWSSEVVDLAALGAIDMDVKAQAEKVHLDRLDATGGVLAASVKDGKLDLSVQQLELDKGHITGQLQLGGAQKSQPAQAAITLGIDGVPVDSVLKEFMANPVLTGATKLDVSASGQGRTQRDLVGSLTGKASFAISNGAITGIDIRSLILQWWQSWSFDPTHKTEFSLLQGSYDIHQGDLQSVSDLAFRGKDVDISSSGNINIATGAVSQSVRLQLTPPPTHFPIPLKVSGTLKSPSVGLDWSSIFSSPSTLGNPGQLALSPQPLPPAIQQKVQGILTANANNPKLAPETREVLQSLLPAPTAANSKN
jgi:AsmA protein